MNGGVGGVDAQGGSLVVFGDVFKEGFVEGFSGVSVSRDVAVQEDGVGCTWCRRVVSLRRKTARLMLSVHSTSVLIPPSHSPPAHAIPIPE